MNCPHTGLNTAKMIKKIFKEYEVEEKMFRTITDNASSMIKAARDLRRLRDGDEEDLEYSDDENEVDESDHNYSDSGSDDSEEDDVEPDEIDDDNTEVRDVERQVEDLKNLHEDHNDALRNLNISCNPCVVHKLQLPIQKVISSKQARMWSYKTDLPSSINLQNK